MYDVEYVTFMRPKIIKYHYYITLKIIWYILDHACLIALCGNALGVDKDLTGISFPLTNKAMYYMFHVRRYDQRGFNKSSTVENRNKNRMVIDQFTQSGWSASLQCSKQFSYTNPTGIIKMSSRLFESLCQSYIQYTGTRSLV